MAIAGAVLATATLVGLTYPRHAHAANPPDAMYVGDSTMVGEEPYLPAYDGVDTVLAFDGISIDEAYQAWGPQIQANPPPIVAISLGLNDTETGLGFLFQVERFVELFPATTKIIWIQPTVEMRWWSWRQPSWPQVNADASTIGYIASLHQNMVMMPWNPQPSWYSDGVHYTAQGYQIRAEEFLAEAQKVGT